MSKSSELSWVRSHVRVLLEDLWDVCRVNVDSDGDVPFRRGTAAGWISVLGSEPIMVRVFAHAARELKPSAKLRRELNELQQSTLSTRLDLCGRTVLVSQTISPIALTVPVLHQAIDCVGGVAAEVGPLLAAMFDGSTPFDAPPAVEEEAGAADDCR